MIGRFIPKSEFNRNVLTLMTGTTIAQALPVLISPILTRIYTPADFGSFAVYMAVTSLLAVIATGRYELAVMLPEKEERAAGVVTLSLLVASVISLLASAFIAVFEDAVCHSLKVPPGSNWIYLIPASVFLVGAYQVLNYWLIRKKAFHKSAANKVAQTITTETSNLSLGFLYFPFGLIISKFLGFLVVAVMSLRQAAREAFSWKGITVSQLREDAVRYKHFPLYSALPALLNAIGLALPVLLINQFFSGVEAGYFNLARQVVNAPFMMLGLSVSQVLFEQASQRRNEKQPLLPVLNSVILKLGVAGLLFIGLMVLFAPQLFSLIFGKEWLEAGNYTRLLVVSFSLQFVVTPLSVVFSALERVKLGSIWQLGYFCLVSCLFLAKNLTISQFLLAYVVVDVIAYGIYYLLFYKVAREFDKSLFVK